MRMKMLLHQIPLITALSFAWMALAQQAEARTLWSGSFVDLSAIESTAAVGINYPAVGPRRICGIELKSHTMILHRRVWDDVAAGLSVYVVVDEDQSELSPVTEQAEGAKLTYRLSDLTAPYVNIWLRTRDESPLKEYFLRKLGGESNTSSVIAVALTCT